MPEAPKKTRPVIRIDGHVLTMDDLTLAEFRTIEDKTQVPWHRVNPLRSAGEASAVLFVVLRRGGTPAEQAQARVDVMSLGQALEHIRLEDYEHEDDRPSEYVDGAPVVDPLAAPAAPGTTLS